MSKRAFYITLSLFGAAVWLFFALACPGQLHFIEGNQAFLYTFCYARETICEAGGIANYIGAFLSQFYYWPLLGGLLIAALAVLTALALERLCRSSVLLPLCLIPSAAYTVLLCDPNWTLAGFVAICATLWVVAGLCRIKNRPVRYVSLALAAPLVFQTLLRAKFFEYMIAPVELYRIVTGACAAIAVCVSLVNLRKEKMALQIILYVVIFTATGVGMVKRHDNLDEEIHRYGYMVRVRDWDGILKAASKKEPASPVSTNAVNLALLMKGELGERMFTFFQKGPRSLVNFEERQVSSEILFLCGFVNEAQHVAFEDMAANPNRTRGVYHLTRLAQFGAVGNRSKELNYKYLNTLKQTLFYRNFEPDTTLVSPGMEPCADFFFDFSNFERNLRILHDQRPDNRRVSEYLAASMLLNKNLQEFVETFCQGEGLPRHWREAKGLIDTYNGLTPTEDLAKYIQAFNNVRGNGNKMSRYAGTYWYYFNFR